VIHLHAWHNRSKYSQTQNSSAARAIGRSGYLRCSHAWLSHDWRLTCSSSTFCIGDPPWLVLCGKHTWLVRIEASENVYSSCTRLFSFDSFICINLSQKLQKCWTHYTVLTKPKCTSVWWIWHWERLLPQALSFAFTSVDRICYERESFFKTCARVLTSADISVKRGIHVG